MPAKTDRILDLLPGTFAPRPAPTALLALLGAFGGELQAAENHIAEVLQAHWADLADRGAGPADTPHDLALLAALYGLAPRDDEGVEDFRAHLKRHVQTFLGGTVTVRGLLRIAAEALALDIDDAHLDPWWRRRGTDLVTTAPDGRDAAAAVFGPPAVATGQDGADAVVVGSADLTGGADVRTAPFLRLAAEDGATTVIDLGTATAHPERLDGADVLAAVRAAAPWVTSSLVDGRLRLSTPAGLEVVEGDGDAAGIVLGLPARRFAGADAAPAVLSGLSCPDGVELTDQGPRYLRVALETGARELDLGTGHRTAQEVADAINAAFGSTVAAVDPASARLVLTSPTSGPAGRVEIAAPAAQDAGGLLFGTRLATGSPARTARLTGSADLTGPLDLSGQPPLRLLIDGTPVTVDLAGLTSRIALGTAIDTAAGAPVTELGGTGLTVVSRVAGAGGEVVLLEPELWGVPDPGTTLFGLPGRRFAARAASTAELTGAVVLAPGTDLAARHLLRLAIDGADPVIVDLRATADGVRSAAAARAVPPGAIVAAVEARLPGVASLVARPDGPHLALRSPSPGAAGRVEVRATTRTLRRAYVTRATVTEEAGQALLGYLQRAVTGATAAPAQVTGTVDLTRGTDLAAGGLLRLAVDGGAPQDVDCAGPRPRATLAADVLAALEAVFPGVAAIEGGRLVLRSPTPGLLGRLAFDFPRPALRRLGFGDAPPQAQGTDPGGIRLVGTADLSGGVDLPAGAALVIGVDGAPPAQIPLTPDGAARVGLDQVVIAVNAALVRSVASRDEAHLILRSPTAGSGSRLELAVPSGPGAIDATAAVLGFAAPRGYAGSAAAPARLVAPAELGGELDLRRARHLLLSADGGPPAPVDLAATATDPGRATLPDVVAAVNAAAPGVASAEAGRLVLTSLVSGTASRIVLAPDPADDGRASLLGSFPGAATGTAAAPPTLVGDVTVPGTVDLSRRSVLRLEIDGEPVGVQVAGPVAHTTSLDEAIAAVNTVLPGTAGRTDDDRLRLTGPPGSTSLAVTPLRYLDLTEYLPAADLSAAGPMTVTSAGTWTVAGDSVRAEPAVLRMVMPHGAAGPAVQGPAGILRADVLVPPGGELLVAAAGPDPGPAVLAWIIAPGGPPAEVPAARLQIEPARGYRPGDVLSIPVGRSVWRYLAGDTSRFDACAFQPPVPPAGGATRLPPAFFAGPPFARPGILDASTFTNGTEITVFNGPPVPASAADVTMSWRPHRAGTLAVTAPLDLDPRFGARFGQAFFAHPDGDAERFPGAVCEPDTDEWYLPRLITTGHPATLAIPAIPPSGLVDARLVPSLPLGYAAQPMPFRVPVRLSGGGPVTGNSDGRARLFLSEEGFGGQFLELAAKQPGPAGNALEVAARPAGPGRFDVTVALRGARFESAAAAILGGAPQPDVSGLLAPAPVGIRLACAGGVECSAGRRDTGTSISSPEQKG